MTEYDKQRNLGYDWIRFVATMMILFHHFLTTLKSNHLHFPLGLEHIINYGGMRWGGEGVALFFILSGALLYKHYKDNFNMGLFYKKRYQRILIPQQIGFIAALIATYIVSPSIIDRDKLGLLLSFLGLNYTQGFWDNFGVSVTWLIGEWFTFVIILLYVLFPLLRFMFLRYCLISTLFVTAIFILNLEFQILSYANGGFSISNGIMCFWVGMLFEKHKNILNTNTLTLSIFFLGILYVLKPVRIGGYTYPVVFISSILLFVILYHIKLDLKFVRYICNYNYEIYLVHHRIFILLLPRLITGNSNDLQLLYCCFFLLGLTFMASEALHRASDFTTQKILSWNNNKLLS